MRATALARSCSQLAVVRLFMDGVIYRVLALAFLVLTHPGCAYNSRTDCTTSDPPLALTSISSPLPDKAFNADISLPYGLPPMKAGQKEFVPVLVRNNSDMVWPAIGLSGARQSDYKYYIRLAAHWLDASGTTLVHEDERQSLPYDLQPREQAEFLIRVVPPKIPGAYTLEIDLVQETVLWFSQKGSKALILKVTVE
ncbi:MAG: hypothetical protein ACR2G5_02110 [Pyrinomonadaceae bacterium]